MPGRNLAIFGPVREQQICFTLWRGHGRSCGLIDSYTGASHRLPIRHHADSDASRWAQFDAELRPCKRSYLGRGDRHATLQLIVAALREDQFLLVKLVVD